MASNHANVLEKKRKLSVYIRKELNSHRIVLVHKNGRRFTVLEYQYDCLELMWKSYILPWKAARSDDGHPQIEGVLFSAALVFETKKIVYDFSNTRWYLLNWFFFSLHHRSTSGRCSWKSMVTKRPCFWWRYCYLILLFSNLLVANLCVCFFGFLERNFFHQAN